MEIKTACETPGCARAAEVGELCVACYNAGYDRRHRPVAKGDDNERQGERTEEETLTEQVCRNCGRKRSEVKGFNTERGLCRSCMIREAKGKNPASKGQCVQPAAPGEGAVKGSGDKTGDMKMTDARGEQPDMVNHPPHYNKGRIEVMDFIEDQGLDYPAGNVVKYVVRAPHKGDALTDYKKALWYLERLIKREEARRKGA